MLELLFELILMLAVIALPFVVLYRGFQDYKLKQDAARAIIELAKKQREKDEK